MARTESKMLTLGTIAPAFSLPDVVTNKLIALDDYNDSKAFVIMFICNHCPYVIHVNPEIVKLSNEYQKKGVAFFAINSNDIVNYPQDAPELMKEQALKLGYTFPYLFDETQQVAKNYDAACTPDFYVFDKNKKLTAEIDGENCYGKEKIRRILEVIPEKNINKEESVAYSDSNSDRAFLAIAKTFNKINRRKWKIISTVKK